VEIECCIKRKGLVRRGVKHYKFGYQTPPHFVANKLIIGFSFQSQIRVMLKYHLKLFTYLFSARFGNWRIYTTNYISEEFFFSESVAGSTQKFDSLNYPHNFLETAFLLSFRGKFACTSSLPCFDRETNPVELFMRCRR